MGNSLGTLYGWLLNFFLTLRKYCPSISASLHSDLWVHTVRYNSIDPKDVDTTESNLKLLDNPDILFQPFYIPSTSQRVGEWNRLCS